ncbi:MAG: hypothetical protein AB1442_07545 [Nitrospirota bacterium]
MKIVLSIVFVIGTIIATCGCVATIEPDGYYGNRHYYYYDYPRYRYFYYDYGYPYRHGHYYRFRGGRHRR